MTAATTATGEGQAPDPQSGQEPQTAAGATATPQVGTGTAGSQAPATTPTDDPIILRQKLDEANREAARLRTEKKKRDDADEAARVAALSDSEKVVAERDAAAKRVTELEAENQRLQADAEARDLGAKLGLADYRDALALIPADQIERGKDGKPTNLEALFRALLAEKPYLAKTGTPPPPSTGASAGTSGGPAPRLTADELDAAKRTGTSPERYAAMKNVKTLADYQLANPPKH